MKDYRIKLKVGYTERITNAVFGDGLSIKIAKDTGQQYYREVLSGKVSFTNGDYQFIMNYNIDQKIEFILQNYEHGQWWDLISGYFYHTDCEIDEDRQIIEVEPTTDDCYIEFSGALDKEVDLIKLKPAISPVLIDVRPCLQVYAAGASAITCVVESMHWEQDCEIVTDDTELTNTHHFSHWGIGGVISVGGTHTPSVPSEIIGFSNGDKTLFTITDGQYSVRAHFDGEDWRVILYVNSVVKFYGVQSRNELSFPATITLYPVPGSGSTGTCELSFDMQDFYGRIVCNVDALAGNDTYDISPNDITGNRNYKKVIDIGMGGDLALSINGTLSATPTEWGAYEAAQYYTKPTTIGYIWQPIMRETWGRASYWLSIGTTMQLHDANGRKTMLLKDAYNLRVALRAVIAEVAPFIVGTGIVESDFLFTSTNPLDSTTNHLKYITPRSNILNINYSSPAQTAPVTLRQLLDMLCVCYRCFWYITIGKKLKIEHIEYFRRGFSYTLVGSPSVDITLGVAARNGKYWDYLTNKYKFDKPNMPCRYEFGWADEQTPKFNGSPIEMVSNFVDIERVEKFVPAGFDADVDYLIANPNGVSKDGFVLLEADAYNMLAQPITVYLGAFILRRVLLNYNTVSGETVEALFSYSGTIQIAACDKNYNVLATLENLSGSGNDINSFWTLPAGTAIIMVTGDGSVGMVALSEFYPEYDKVLYEDFTENSLTYSLQNGTLTFAVLCKWYLYDLPCSHYSIDGNSNYALGVAKNKIQDVTLPNVPYIDATKFIKTGLGNGKIRELTINLSSKEAKGTLEYDTE